MLRILHGGSCGGPYEMPCGIQGEGGEGDNSGGESGDAVEMAYHQGMVELRYFHLRIHKNSRQGKV